mmetsp:Transcript_62096/g.110646  ORF Transcript_62096/g.110646 Transcript_62096/m.110646 type:complete len:308 (+) Transcript_62096:443-1366(+)
MCFARPVTSCRDRPSISRHIARTTCSYCTVKLRWMGMYRASAMGSICSRPAFPKPATCIRRCELVPTCPALTSFPVKSRGPAGTEIIRRRTSKRLAGSTFVCSWSKKAHRTLNSARTIWFWSAAISKLANTVTTMALSRMQLDVTMNIKKKGTAAEVPQDLCTSQPAGLRMHDSIIWCQPSMVLIENNRTNAWYRSEKLRVSPNPNGYISRYTGWEKSMRPNICTPATANMKKTIAIKARILMSPGSARKSAKAQIRMPSIRFIIRSTLNTRNTLAPGPSKGSITIDTTTKNKSNLFQESVRYPCKP